MTSKLRCRPKSRRPRFEALELRQLLAVDGLSLAADSVKVGQNSGSITLDVLANDDFDADYVGDRRITSVSTGSLGGQIQILGDGLSLRYTPPGDVGGVETFQYSVDNRQTAEVSVEISSPLPEFNQTIYLFQQEYEFDLLARAAFPEDYAGEKRITLISETQDGADVQISDDGTSVLYRSRIGVQGQDRFNYIVDDLYFGIAKINVVNPIDDDRYEVLQGSGRTELRVLDNDFLAGADPSINLAEVKANARITHVLSNSEDFDVEIADDGRSIYFTPTTDRFDYTWYASFRYVVDARFEQTVSVRVLRPVQNDSFNADIDGGAHFLNVLDNDTYVSIFGGNRRIVDRVTAVTQGDQGGTVAISEDGTRVVYTPTAGFTGAEVFEYTADEKYSATVVVNVTSPVRDDFEIAYVGSNNRLDVLANDFFAALPGEVTITSVSESEIGSSIHIDPDGVIVYTPPQDALTREPAAFTDTFQYTVNDRLTATVLVRLQKITRSDQFRVDRPIQQAIEVLENDYFNQDYPGAAIITAVSTPTEGGTVSIATGGRGLIYQPGSERETFTYTVDDKFTETVVINPIKRLAFDRSVADQNGDAITIDVTANDFPVDDYYVRAYGPYLGNRVLTSVSQSEQGGTVSITADGNVSYLPPPDYVGQDAFTYTIDNFLTELVRIDVVRRTNDDAVHIASGATEMLNVLANDILGADYDGTGVITAVTESVAGADVTIADDGRSIVYTPPADFQGEDNFVYTLDGQSKATVTVSVHDSASDLHTKFDTVDQLRDYLLELSVERNQNLFGQPGYVFDYRYVEDAASAGNFSETNVQVAGVDEDDIVETDGNFVYSLRGDELAIVRSLPADQLEVTSRTQIEGTPVGMYLNGDRLTVISRVYAPVEAYDKPTFAAFAGDLIFPPPFPRNVTTIVTVLDVADRTSPTVVQRTTFEGDFAKSRRIGDHVFLVLQSRELLLAPELILDDSGASGVYETEQQFIQRVVENFTSLLEELLPGYESYDRQGELVRGGPLVLPEDIYRSPDNETSMTIVASINMASDEPGLSATSGVLSGGGIEIYATADSLYVFNPDRSLGDNGPTTRIMKFDWDGLSGAIDFAAIGKVPGSLLNQFSADEHNGLLRVTTEISNSETGNFTGLDETGLFVLQDDQGVLEFVGSLQNLAVGQDVKSVRYFGERAFVTTFETVDPLYGIDLSDPSAPRVMGHVSIPGFNSYMQFIADDRLLTVGTNSATGHGGRAMVSLFDVADLTAPRLIDQYNLPQFSTSEANFDHHAFGWFAPHELLAVPISRYYQDRFDDDGDGYREAIRVVREDALSILHIGVLDSSSPEGITPQGQIEHDARVLRSVYINDYVYSIGLDAVRTVNVADPNTIIGEVLFGDDPQDVTPVTQRSIVDTRSLSGAAREQLAAALEMEIGDVLLVTQENNDGKAEIVVRAGEQHYRYAGSTPEDLELADQGFQFLDKWHNIANAFDVNNDSRVTANDALMIINELARRAGRELPVDRVLRQINVVARFADTNNDGHVTALDALIVINRLSRESAATAQAEQAQAIDWILSKDEQELGDFEEYTPGKLF